MQLTLTFDLFLMGHAIQCSLENILKCPYHFNSNQLNRSTQKKLRTVTIFNSETKAFVKLLDLTKKNKEKKLVYKQVETELIRGQFKGKT